MDNTYRKFPNGVTIDMWYGDNVKDCDKFDYAFYCDSEKDHPLFAPYRGNLWKNGKMVGDWTANTLQDFEEVIRKLCA